MSRPRYYVPSDSIRCVAVARWSGGFRCKKPASGPLRLCPTHLKARNRPKPPVSELVQRLAVVHLAGDREIRIELREREGSRYIGIRLFFGDTPTRKGISILESQLGALAQGLADAARELEP